MAFDMKKHNPATVAESGFEFELELPDGTLTGAKIKVRGVQSPKVKDFIRKYFDEKTIRDNAAKKRGQIVDELTSKEGERFAVDNASIRVISWTGFAEDGVDVPCTEENIRHVMTEYVYIREAVTRESDNIYNFRHKLDK